jgi:membrane fusion protein
MDGKEKLEKSSVLFRREVADFRRDRLHGAVNLTLPLTWQLIGFVFLAALIGAGAFLYFGSYTRVQVVRGTITLDAGIATIVPTREGVVERLLVHEGQVVRRGEPLIVVRSEEDMVAGGTVPARIHLSLAEQDAGLVRQARSTQAAANESVARLNATISGAIAELTSLSVQRGQQKRLVEVAQADFENAKRIAVDGFVSRRDLDRREATVLERQQQLAQFEQLEAAKRAQLAEARRALGEARSNAQAQVAAIGTARAALDQQVAEADRTRGYALNAPVDGVVTALTTQAGQAARSGQILLQIIPAKAVAKAELYVPTSAAGFVAPGQTVRLAIDAYPYQSFGTVTGRIRDMSGAAVNRDGANGPAPVYLVNVDLMPRAERSLDPRRSLLPGMTLTARILTERRTFLQWLLPVPGR